MNPKFGSLGSCDECGRQEIPDQDGLCLLPENLEGVTSPRLERTEQMSLVKKCLPPASPNISSQLSTTLPTLFCDVSESKLFGFLVVRVVHFRKKEECFKNTVENVLADQVSGCETTWQGWFYFS